MTEDTGIQEAETHLERLLLLENVSEGLASLDTERVAAEVDLLEVSNLLELVKVRLNVSLGVELEVLPHDGEDVCVRHDVCEKGLGGRGREGGGRDGRR